MSGLHQTNPTIDGSGRILSEQMGLPIGCEVKVLKPSPSRKTWNLLVKNLLKICPVRDWLRKITTLLRMDLWYSPLLTTSKGAIAAKAVAATVPTAFAVNDTLPD